MTADPIQLDSRHGESPLETRRRTQLVLQHVRQLPTLSAIAVRLLEVTSSEDSSAEDVVELISADPALASKVISLCRKASRGVTINDGDIHRAVVLLGFEEVRMTALSVEVFELMRGVTSAGGERHGETSAFEPVAFWRHCVAVGAAAELITRQKKSPSAMRPAEAFLAGLLHDVGQLALYTVLPKTFDRACRLAEEHSRDLDAVCRKVIGVGPGLFGKHLADHWRLPEKLTHIIWLRGQRPEALPESAGRDSINLITCADLLARRQMLAHAGHGPDPDALEHILRVMGLESDAVEAVCAQLHAAVSARAEALGIGNETPETILRASIERAGRMLERTRAASERKRTPRSGSALIAAANAFFDEAPICAPLPDVIAAVARSAASLLRGTTFLRIAINNHDGVREVFRFDGALSRRAATDIRSPSSSQTPQMGLQEDDEDDDAVPSRGTRTIGLDMGDGPAVIAHDGQLAAGIEPESLTLLRRLWGGAIGAAIGRDRAAALSEEIVEANRELLEAQAALAEKRAMAALGELASGAAHEMNNPLTIISGRSQLLAAKIDDPALKAAAQEIVTQTCRLSDLITGLRLSAEIQRARPETVGVAKFVNETVEEFTNRTGWAARIEIDVQPELPPARFDPRQIGRALLEILQNAHDADPDCEVRVRIQTDPFDDRLMISVIDTGPGLSARALEHAFDPFFSEKPAGRQTGLGLSRARRLVEINGGELSLTNGAERGAAATIALSDWRSVPRHRDKSNRTAA